MILGAMAVGGYMLFSKKANAATQPRQVVNAGIAAKPSNNGLLLGSLDSAFGPLSMALGKALGASWGVSPNTVETVDWRSGAIGNYSGMSQSDANKAATTDYNNQFISPFGVSPFQFGN